MNTPTVESLPSTVRTLSRAQAAQAVGVSVRTLESLAAQGKGPRVTRIGGRCLYRLCDLESWLEQQASGPAA